MLKKRLIACLLWKNGILIQSKNFRHTNAVGSAFVATEFFNTWAIDEIVLLDVSRSQESRERFHEELAELSRRCFVPLSVGGWIDSVDDMRRCLNDGADKVVLNTEAFRSPDLLEEGARNFGKQCMVVSIDAKKNESGAHKVMIDRGSEETDASPEQWAMDAEKHGAGEIFLTSIDKDGQMKGYDIPLIHSVSNAINIPVIASGGVGNWQHLADGILQGHADAVSAANIFHYSEQSTKKAKNALYESGIPVRQPEFYQIATPRKPEYPA